MNIEKTKNKMKTWKTQAALVSGAPFFSELSEGEIKKGLCVRQMS